MKRLAKSGKLSSSGFNLNTLTDSLEHVETYERAGEEVRHILETYEPPKLSDAVLKKVRDIVDGAEAELGITG